jgi:cyclic pyranopterin phosphate synthase
LKDSFGREIDYLRISITDLCNLRCMYCMPDEGIPKKSHSDIMALEEIAEIARAAVGLGVRKIRITGGEPLVRKGVVELCREIARIPGLQDLAITTNGILLAGMAKELKEAGVNRINISIDTLDPEKFKMITRGGTLRDVLDGIGAAMDCGMSPVKLNTVLIGGFNDAEIPALAELTREKPIEVRFIELMPIGHTVPFGREAYIPCAAVLERLPELEPAARSGGVARLYRLPGARGRIGLISPLSNHFCGDCNRIRLTADGKLKPCLHSAEEIQVRGLHGKELEETLRTAVWHKPSRHGNLSDTERSEAQRNMNQIGG